MVGLQKVLKVVLPCLKKYADVMTQVCKVATGAGENGTVLLVISTVGGLFLNTLPFSGLNRYKCGRAMSGEWDGQSLPPTLCVSVCDNSTPKGSLLISSKALLDRAYLV
jgi:hypothetical protein